MNRQRRLTLRPGVSIALIAAILFGASTPLSKVLLGQVDPVLLAGLLYLSSGIGLALWWWLRVYFTERGFREASLKKGDLPWLAGAIFTGGIVGPVLLLRGLTITPASSASLLLNLEGVLTAVVAWLVFKEHFERRLILGMIAITTGGLLLSWAGQIEPGTPWGVVAIIGACLAWSVDNNLTRKVSAGDPVQIAATKGLVAGTVNLAIALTSGANIPEVLPVVAAVFVGFSGYGMSLVFFVLALRHLGTARTGAYFSVAPFVGAALSIALLGDRLTVQFVLAAVLMGSGVWLHLTERHVHKHWHDPLGHDHRHAHDEHHRHEHGEESHSHFHTHGAMLHCHPHYPDVHHRHAH